MSKVYPSTQFKRSPGHRSRRQLELLGRYIPRGEKEVTLERELDGIKSTSGEELRVLPSSASHSLEVNSSPDSRLCKLMHGDQRWRKGSGGEQHSGGEVVHLQDEGGGQ